ncbi:(deoxy)nucleoside triphosphate pyrophosphohydrolase [Crocinitomix algicola]|uniref:(deoxy)nucleoside triphosphate pyrophosphohydrolase n=1 Tax=Crocinitomix algicola TaxID=1740263 RepID=UPI0008727E89|nr:(deoxy)nucleoside triphosphate pyrophosphohydrolase [Crocinitomix algicola]
MKKIEVVAAIIKLKDEILSVQRPPHKLDYISEKFEFPGGKIEAGETKEQSLRRELKEELKLNADIGKHLITVEHSYPDFELTMHAYIVNVNSKDISLTEHISQLWLIKEEIYSVDWAAADIPIVDKLNSIEWKTL